MFLYSLLLSQFFAQINHPATPTPVCSQSAFSSDVSTSSSVLFYIFSPHFFTHQRSIMGFYGTVSDLPMLCFAPRDYSSVSVSTFCCHFRIIILLNNKYFSCFFQLLVYVCILGSNLLNLEKTPVYDKTAYWIRLRWPRCQMSIQFCFSNYIFTTALSKELSITTKFKEFVFTLVPLNHLLHPATFLFVHTVWLPKQLNLL